MIFPLAVSPTVTALAVVEWTKEEGIVQRAIATLSIVVKTPRTHSSLPVDRCSGVAPPNLAKLVPNNNNFLHIGAMLH